MKSDVMNSIENFEIKRLGSPDVWLFQKLVRLFKEVFETENGAEANKLYLQALLQKPDFIAYAVLLENEVVGGLTAFELPLYYTECSEMFIYDIAVKTEFQRNGLGKALLAALAAYCKKAGIKVMFVAALEEDGHAVNFYHATNGKGEKVVHFNYYLDAPA